MGIQYIFNSHGGYVGFVLHDNLFDPEGEWLGFLRNGNEIYDTSGDFMGYLLDDGRIARRANEPRRMRQLSPLRPMRSMKPLAPLRRLPMVPLLYPWIDVFENAPVTQARERVFPSFGGFFQPLQTGFERLIGGRLVAADGTYLGTISKSRIEPDSIMNRQGQYGNSYNQDSILNQYGNYGSEYSPLSPFNNYSSSPPQIVKNSQSIAALSTNQYVPGAINPRELLKWLESG